MWLKWKQTKEILKLEANQSFLTSEMSLNDIKWLENIYKDVLFTFIVFVLLVTYAGSSGET